MIIGNVPKSMIIGKYYGSVLMKEKQMRARNCAYFVDLDSRPLLTALQDSQAAPTELEWDQLFGSFEGFYNHCIHNDGNVRAKDNTLQILVTLFLPYFYPVSTLFLPCFYPISTTEYLRLQCRLS
jgi:hypothetical protein